MAKDDQKDKKEAPRKPIIKPRLKGPPMPQEGPLSPPEIESVKRRYV